MNEENCESDRFADSIVEGCRRTARRTVLGLKVTHTIEERSTERIGMTSGRCNVDRLVFRWKRNVFAVRQELDAYFASG